MPEPPYIGLCPGEHQQEFYMPLDSGEPATCPECSETMVLYIPLAECEERERAAEKALRMIADGVWNRNPSKPDLSAQKFASAAVRRLK
jgi:hypothetical protein